MRRHSLRGAVLIALAIASSGRSAGAQAGAPQAAAGASPIDGFWFLLSDATVGGKVLSTPVHRVRAFVNREWYYAQSSPATTSVDFLYGGTFAVAGSGYTEAVTYSSVSAESMLKQVVPFQFKVEGDTLTITGKHGLTGPPSMDSTEVWRRLSPSLTAEDKARIAPSAEEMTEIELARQTMSAAPQNLAGSYLNNHGRLAMIAMVQKGGMNNVNFIIGSEKVTPDNAASISKQFQHREEAYVAELKRRGTSPMTGPYRLSTMPPCDASDPPVDVELKQDGFSIDIRFAGADGKHATSGVLVAGVLTIGEGDFSPDTYAFGKIGADGRVEMKPFSGQGCAMVLAKR